jgi:hypothetical protein
MKGNGIGTEFRGQFFNRDAFAEYCGIGLTEAFEWYAVAAVNFREFSE